MQFKGEQPPRQNFEQHPRLKRIEVPHPEEYNEELHNYLESILLLSEQKAIARWGRQDATDEELSQMQESLSDHLGGLFVLSQNVLHRAKREQDKSITDLKWEKVYQMIAVHDLAEVIFGDKVHKTELDEEEEDRAEQVIIDEAEKRGMGNWVADILAEYWEKTPDGRKGSPEANFVKTLDEIEGIAHMFVARRIDLDKRGQEEHKEFFEKYARDIPALKEFALYMNEVKEELRDDPEWAYHAGQEEFDFQREEKQ
jgi:5'-deoxynucleotidase YfbR-like HD superfamily hydrolase